MNLSIIIPTYNESRYLDSTIQRIIHHFQSKHITYEVIIVNDGSTDDTEKIARAIARSYNNISLVSYDINKGKGYAVRSGIEKSIGEKILFMDADNSVDISYSDVFLQQKEEFVIASIYLKYAKVHDESFLWRRLLRKISRNIPKYILHINVQDTQRGFKMFQNKHKQLFLEKLTQSKFSFDMEMITIATENNIKIKEIPVNWNNPKRNHVGFRDYVQTLQDVFSIYSKKKRGFYKK